MLHPSSGVMDPARTVIFTLALLLLVSGCVHTLPFKDANGHLIPGSVATMQFANIGGTSQSVWFRGTSRSSPALVLLHGGPGTSESALFRHYNSMLEHHFLVVYWEQRGTGRSFNSAISAQTMNIAQFVRDLDEVVELVRRRFGKDKVILLPHSWFSGQSMSRATPKRFRLMSLSRKTPCTRHAC
jgi:proline iminopeptidase